MDFQRGLRWCLLIAAEEALVGFFGTRDKVTQLWPAVAPFLTPLGFGLGLAALSMYFERWISDFKEWRKEQKAAQQQETLRREEDALRKLKFIKRLLEDDGPAGTATTEKIKVVLSELKRMGLIIKKKKGSSAGSYEKICRAEVYVEELGLEEAVKRFKEEEKEK